jgi:hypothetical protein
MRHLIIPDTQIRPGCDTTHLDWAARAAIDYKPDVIAVMGDWWDLPSLSTHDAPGSKEAEGRRVMPDIDAGNEAFARFAGLIQREIDRIASNHKRRWLPRREFFFGNHENRLTRAIFRDPKWEGIISLASLKTPGFIRNEFLHIENIHGVRYSHYFPNPFTGKPLGGSIVNRLNNVGHTFVQGHQQGFLYASKQYPDHVKHGLVCGRFYTHSESYRAPDVQASEWNGIVVLNDVRERNGEGDFDLMPLSINYLREKYA